MPALVQIGGKRSGASSARPPAEAFLPTNLAEARVRGWEGLDVVLVNGDAYVDHPTFGVPLLARVLLARGFKVGIVSQPRWDEASFAEDFAACGRPRLFFGVSSGNMDSMVNHYTAAKKRRTSDAYTPDAAPGARPDYATAIYARKLKKLFPDVPVVIGGVEASLRRLAHYDYWSDRVRHSILIDCPGDILVYGMGEEPILEIARRLADGEDICGLAQRGVGPARDRELEGRARLDRRGLGHRRRDRQHVAHGLHRRRVAQGLPARVVRVSERLREVRHRSRAAHPADEESTRAARG